jgi:hypothetical protein
MYGVQAEHSGKSFRIIFQQRCMADSHCVLNFAAFQPRGPCRFRFRRDGHIVCSLAVQPIDRVVVPTTAGPAYRLHHRADADVLLEYRSVVWGPDGCGYRARARGGRAGDGTRRWHGWIEFWPIDGTAPVRTSAETTQPDRGCTVYWSTGLSRAYLEGALRRAHRPVNVAPVSATGRRRMTSSNRDAAVRAPRRTIQQSE